jgi:hypothetical protein
VDQGIEGVWLALAVEDGGNDPDTGTTVDKEAGTGGVSGKKRSSYSYMTEVLPNRWKELLKPGTGFGEFLFLIMATIINYLTVHLIDISRYRVQQEIFTVASPLKKSRPRSQIAAPSSIVDRLAKMTPIYVMEYRFTFATPVRDSVDMYRPPSIIPGASKIKLIEIPTRDSLPGAPTESNRASRLYRKGKEIWFGILDALSGAISQAWAYIVLVFLTCRAVFSR